MDSRFRRMVAIATDLLLGVLAPLTGLITRRSVTGSLVNRVLVVRCDHIGDLVMATPALRRLRSGFPGAHVTLLAGPWASDVVDVPALVDSVVVYAAPWWLSARGAGRRDRFRAWMGLLPLIRSLRKQQFDIAIDLRGDLRQILFFLVGSGAPQRVGTDRTGGRSLLTVCQPFAVGVHEVKRGLSLIARVLGEDELAMTSPCSHPLEVGEGSDVDPIIGSELNARPFVALIGRGNAPNKTWPVQNASGLIRRVSEEMGLGTVILGSRADAAYGDAVVDCGALNLAGRTTLAQTIRIMRKAAVVVAVDTGTMHLAAATAVPVVALFGPTNPEYYAPWCTTHTVLAPQAPCGCIGGQCQRIRHKDGAPCMVAIDTESVLSAIRKLVSSGSHDSSHPMVLH